MTQQLPPPLPFPLTRRFEAGKVTANDVAAVQHEFDACQTIYVKSRDELKSSTRRVGRANQSLAWFEWRRSFRNRVRNLCGKIGRAADVSISRKGAIVIAGAILVGLSLLAADQFLLRFSLAYLFGIGIVVAIEVVVTAWFFWMMKCPSDAALDLLAIQAADSVANAGRNEAAARSRFEEAARRLPIAEDNLSQAQEVYGGHLNRLLTCNWQGLAGTAFEQFLAEVFERLGYIVQPTGRTGDQGVDLVAVRANRRLAVQAKGYPGTTVGNHAVMEAHTGMTYYGCHDAVVITNSTFTRAAQECASRVGCRLIDGSQIPDLIRGGVI